MSISTEGILVLRASSLKGIWKNRHPEKLSGMSIEYRSAVSPVEPGTRLAARVARGEVDAPDDDLMASMYELADDRLTTAGLGWYEISNWARPGRACRHNLHYWQDTDWWGLGPGAHSHVGGVRWWNVKHPAAWAARLGGGLSPAAARETLDEATRRLERVMLGLRTVDGAVRRDIEDAVGADAPARLRELGDDGLVENGAETSERVVLTRRGRLLADAEPVGNRPRRDGPGDSVGADTDEGLNLLPERATHGSGAVTCPTGRLGSTRSRRGRFLHPDRAWR